MAAGYAGLSQVLTREAIDGVNARGDRLRTELNALFAREGVALQATGLGSLLTLHGTAVPVRSVADLAHSNALVKDLVFFDLLARGVFIARRGMMALSLPVGDAECDAVLAAVQDVVQTRKSVLPAA
jgi:glutamate-1-semialdehyde 2,1-aminomutase